MPLIKINNKHKANEQKQAGVIKINRAHCAPQNHIMSLPKSCPHQPAPLSPQATQITADKSQEFIRHQQDAHAGYFTETRKRLNN